MVVEILILLSILIFMKCKSLPALPELPDDFENNFFRNFFFFLFLNFFFSELTGNGGKSGNRFY